MAKNLIPKSKAKTAYGLLSEVRKIILEEPKRYHQSEWHANGDYAAYLYGRNIPACGTVCCVGGWIEVLKNEPAPRVLGMDRDLLWVELFASSLVKRDRGETPAAIRAHAKAGAAHIAKFQKKHEKQLKAKRV